MENKVIVSNYVWIAFRKYPDSATVLKDRLLAKFDSKDLLDEWRSTQSFSDDGCEIICGPVELILERVFPDGFSEEWSDEEEIVEYLFKIQYSPWEITENVNGYKTSDDNDISHITKFDFTSRRYGKDKVALNRLISNIKTIPERMVEVTHWGPWLAFDGEPYDDYVVENSDG